MLVTDDSQIADYDCRILCLWGTGANASRSVEEGNTGGTLRSLASHFTRYVGPK